jgi:hypothetical protein
VEFQSRGFSRRDRHKTDKPFRANVDFLPFRLWKRSQPRNATMRVQRNPTCNLNRKVSRIAIIRLKVLSRSNFTFQLLAQLLASLFVTRDETILSVGCQSTGIQLEFANWLSVNERIKSKLSFRLSIGKITTLSKPLVHHCISLKGSHVS